MPTKKDYEEVAAILHDERVHIRLVNAKKDGTITKKGADELTAIRRVEARLVAYFQKDNPLFDPQRFTLASGAHKGDRT